MSSLTEEQRKRIEENRQKALNRLKAAGVTIPNNGTPVKPTPTSSLNRNTFSPVNSGSSNSGNSTCSTARQDAKPNSGTASNPNDHKNPKNWFPSSTPSTSQKNSQFNLSSSSTSGSNVKHTMQPLGVKATEYGSKSNWFSQKSSSNFNGSSAGGSNGTHIMLPLGVKATEYGDKSNWFSSQSSSKPLTGSCWLSAVDRFSVKVAYNAELIEAFKTIPGKSYDVKNIVWSFPLSEYENFRRTVDPFRPTISIGAIPSYVLAIFRKREKKYYEMNIDISRIEPKLLKSLYPFQREGVQFGISKKGRCIIADDMGLGKTIQALGISHYYRSDWPLLIVCPSSMRYQWEQEIITHLPSVSSVRIHVVTSSKDEVINPLVVIISYDLMNRMEAVLMSLKFGVIIMDESHLLKSSKSARSKTGLKLLHKANRCILLSGTPALSRPMELYNQLRAVTPKWVSSIDFGVRYCDGHQGKWGWDFSGCSNMEELKLVLEEKFLIRRLKSDVLSQLPAKIRKVVLLPQEMVKKNTDAMNALSQRLSSEDLRGNEKRSCLLTYFSETGKCKINAIRNYVSDLLEIGSKFLIFAHHTEVLDAISSLLEEKKTYYIRIDGKVSSDERKDVCDQFQYEDRFRVAVLSITAASTGLTLTAANLVVFAELFWTPGTLTQAEDRAHRIGQESSVVIQYLIAKGTADDYLWPLVEKKLNILNQAGLSKDTFSTAATTAVEASDANSQPTITEFFEELDGGNNDDDDEDALLANALDDVENSLTPLSKKIKLEVHAVD